MNKVLMISTLAFAIGSTSAMAANVYTDSTTSVDVYGYAKGAHTFNQAQGKNGKDASEFQLGVKAKQQLNKQFALVGQVEGEYDVTSAPKRHTKLRKAFGGIDAAEYGAITVGRQTGALYNVMGLTDVNPETVSGYGSFTDGGFTGRTDSIIQYQNTLGSVTATAQYKLKTTKSSETGLKDNEGAGYALSVVDNNIAGTGVFAGAAYAHQKVETAGIAGSDVYSVGGGWTDGSYYLAGTSTFGTNANGASKFRDNEVIGQYNFQNGITPSLGFVDTNAGGTKHKYVESGVAYAFNKAVTVDVGYGYDLTNSKDSLVKTGIKYKF